MKNKQKKNELLIFWHRLCTDYRHGICVAVILGSIALGVFYFPNGIPRLGEAFFELGVSFAFYAFELFGKVNPIKPTVTQLPSWKWTQERWEPLRLFPWTWEEFKVLWDRYFDVLFTKDNFTGYMEWLQDKLYVLSRVMILVLPVFVVFLILFRRYVEKHVTNRKKRSAPLRSFETAEIGRAHV